MDPTLAEWLNLLLRWLHVIAGVVWIGESFYFNRLEAAFEPPRPARRGIEGEAWLIHGGGFYRVEKIHVAPEAIPERLHWFKYEALFTLLSGLVLLALVYYLEESFLVDPAVSGISHGTAVAVGVGSLAAGWFVYDAIWRSPLGANQAVAATLCCVLLALVAFALTHLLSGRAAYIHVGALLGSIMVLNVWLVILPNQRRVVRAAQSGQALDPAPGRQAGQRSLHNNYMTLPVVFAMISNHYPGTYGHPHNWIVLFGLFAASIAVRHWFNLRHRGRMNYWLWPAAALGTLALFAFADRSVSIRLATGDDKPVVFADVRAVIAQRCASCHAATPTDDAFDQPPKGVAFDTPDQIRRLAQRINAQAVLTQAMPLANKTEMTDDERALLGAWIRQGARVN